MGLKDHHGDGTGHILCLGLDLDYLHVNGAKGPSVVTAAGGGASNTSSSSTNSSYSSSSSCSTYSEESAVSDNEDEHPASFDSGNRKQSEPPRSPRAPSIGSQRARLDLVPETRPEAYSSPELIPGCRSKVDFALKLGYTEELVLLVLRKLGPDALINDMLGELVKLGTRTEMDQQRGVSPSSSLCSLASSCFSNPDSCRLPSPSPLLDDKDNLRPVVVDGSNVAMSHGNKEVFSCQGIQLAVEWFLERGHHDITVFVPAWRKEQSRPDALITEQDILRRLEKDKILVFTPSRRVQGRRVVCYDDRFIVKLAYESDGIIVSNDNYRDLANEKPEWKRFIDERLLMYSFVNDKFMPPDDPLGRHGPSLENFLRKRPVIPEIRKQPCPYAKKCTYGHKCKFYHPERGNQPQRSVADELRASAKTSLGASRGLLEQTIKVKSRSISQSEETSKVEPGLLSKRPNPIPQSSRTDSQGDKLQMNVKPEGCRGSSISRRHTSPEFPVTSERLNRLEFTCDGLDSSSWLAEAESFGRCKSPELGYDSLRKVYSGLSFVASQSPECHLQSDLQAGSLLSDCGSDGGGGLDSFSPDSVTNSTPKCHCRVYSSQCMNLASRSSLGLRQQPPQGHPRRILRSHGSSLGELPASISPRASPHRVKLAPTYLPPQHQLPPLNCYPGELSSQPTLTSTAHWDSGQHRESTASRRNHSWVEQCPQTEINWDPNHHPSSKSCYDLFSYKSFPPLHGKGWQPSWGQQVLHPSARGILSPSSLPFPQQSCPSRTISKSQLEPEPEYSERLALGRYQDLRDRVYVNLCGIFPPDLVKRVMTKNPQMMDAQELAAAILVEKLQHFS